MVEYDSRGEMVVAVAAVAATAALVVTEVTVVTVTMVARLRLQGGPAGVLLQDSEGFPYCRRGLGWGASAGLKLKTNQQSK